MATALTSFHALERFVAQGEEVANDDPIVAAFPSLFDVPKAAPVRKRAAKAQD